MPQHPGSHLEMPYGVESRTQYAFPMPTILSRCSLFTTPIIALKKNLRWGSLWETNQQGPRFIWHLSSRMNFSHAVYKFYKSWTHGPRDHLSFTWIIPSGLRAPLPALGCNHCAPTRGWVWESIGFTTLGNLISFTKQLSEFPLIAWVFHWVI